MTYIVVSANEIVKAEMERPSFSAWEIINPCVNKDRLIKPFQEHCLSLPRIAIQGKHNWTVWQEVEEGKDFTWKALRVEEIPDTYAYKKARYWCDECCNKDRCDDPSHYYRKECPYCLGKGQIDINRIAIPIQPTPEGEKVEERLFTLEQALKIFDAGVSRGESYINGWGYENDNGSAEHYFKDKFGIDI